MNKYNYNVLIIFISSQSYNIDNTTLSEFIELVNVLNKLEMSGEVLFDDITKYLKLYYNMVQENSASSSTSNISSSLNTS